MPYQTGIADALQDAGLDVVVYRGWESRGSSSFTPRGVVVHHTGPWSTVAGMVKLCINGRSDLPGPLCHVVLDPDGTCHVIAAGRANHAGAGGWKGLTGNSTVFGIEAIHSGSSATPWPPAQLDVFPVAAAALAKLAGAGADMVCGHKEWTTRKPDPVTLDMDVFRLRVVAALKAPLAPPPIGGNPVTNHPPKAIVARPQGDGYWEIAYDGGVFAFGNAPALTDIGGDPVERIISADAWPDGEGLLLMGEDGGVFALGSARFFGRVEYRGG